MTDKLQQLLKRCEEQPQNSHMWYLLAMEYRNRAMVEEAGDALTEAMLCCENDGFMVTLQKALEQLAAEKTALEPDVSQRELGRSELKEQSESLRNVPFQVFSGGREEMRDPVSLDSHPRKKITFADVGGLQDVKEAISMKIIQPLLHPELFRQFGQQAGGGILLYGPPGCGKTYIAKAAAGECSALFINLHITDILDQWLGESERKMESVFAKARVQKPSIIFIDEIDMLGYSRTKMRGEGLRGVVDQMLTEMEGVDSNNEGILIIGATNMPWDVDSALRRPGRFDKTVFVPPPDAEAREQIYRINLKDRPKEEGLDYRHLAEKSCLFSGADILNVIEKTSEKLLKEIISTGSRDRKISQQDLLATISETLPSTIEWLRTISDFVRYSNHSGQYNEVERYLEENKGSF